MKRLESAELFGVKWMDFVWTLQLFQLDDTFGEFFEGVKDILK